MRAMILAAGLGKRLRPFTDHTPKPLLPINGKPLIIYHLEALARAGIVEIVININLGHYGQKIADLLQNGRQFGVDIVYSKENPALETGGGIAQALVQLGTDPFLVVSGDIFTDFPFEKLTQSPIALQKNILFRSLNSLRSDSSPSQNTFLKSYKHLAHLVLVENPPFHPKGDYALTNGLIQERGDRLFNFGGIGVYRPELFVGCPKDPFPLALLFKSAIAKQQITGEYYEGRWHNIGTPEELKKAERMDECD